MINDVKLHLVNGLCNAFVLETDKFTTEADK